MNQNGPTAFGLQNSLHTGLPFETVTVPGADMASTHTSKKSGDAISGLEYCNNVTGVSHTSASLEYSTTVQCFGHNNPCGGVANVGQDNTAAPGISCTSALPGLGCTHGTGITCTCVAPATSLGQASPLLDNDIITNNQNFLDSCSQSSVSLQCASQTLPSQQVLGSTVSPVHTNPYMPAAPHNGVVQHQNFNSFHHPNCGTDQYYAAVSNHAAHGQPAINGQFQNHSTTVVAKQISDDIQLW